MSKNIEQVYVANPITSNAGTDLMYFGQSPYGPTDDAAMLYSNFAAQFGAPYTAAALTAGNDTNITLTLGGTPTTALLHAASITAGWSGTLSPARGGTGVNNGSSTITLAGTFQMSGAFSFNGTLTGNTSITYPTSGTLATTSQIPSGAALTEVNDTNVTLTLGGSPTTALVNATSITAGWAGTLSPSRGGTGVNNGASTITLGGNLTTSGAFSSTFTMSGSTNVTFPTSGTLATTSGIVTSITGTANEITASASTGPVTLSISNNPILPGSGGMTFPTGNTAARAGSAGTMRFNSQTTVFEATVDGSTWNTVATSGPGVSSVSGTTNRITSTGGTTPVIDIAATYVGQSSITTLGTIGTGTWQGAVVGPTYGGTGVNNGSSTLTLAGNLTTAGSFASTFTMSGSTSVTFPTSGTLATTSQIPTGAALTEVDDTNVTLTLGGSPNTALVNAASITAGWTGQLSLTRGGSNASLTASNGGIVYSTSSAMAILSGTATANKVLVSGASSAPSWSTATFPATAGSAGTILRSDGTNWVTSTSTFANTYSASTLLYSNGANTVTGLATSNSSSLVTNSSGVPAWSGTMTNGQVIIGSTSATPTAATLTNGSGISITNGAGSITIAATGIGAFVWNDVSGTSQAATINQGYIISNASQTTVTLPATAAEGSVFAIAGKGAAGWILQMNTGQTCHFGSSASSSAGTLTSTNQWDSVQIVCVTANTTFAVTSVIGNLTVA